jgi:hypothetical protein
MRARALTLLSLFAAVTYSCDGSTDVDANFAATLNGTNENPDVTTNGTGVFSATINDDNILTYNLTFTGMNSNVIQAHIHGPATTSLNAGILVDFATSTTTGRTLTTGATSGSATGTVDLKLADVADVGTLSGAEFRTLLEAGALYVNVHTQTNQGGEIRGQILRQ